MQENSALKELDVQSFFVEGIIKEKQFREKLSEHNWKQYQGKSVLIKGCGSVPVPTWVYMMVTAHLVQVAKKVFYGEPCSSIPIFYKSALVEH